MKSHAPLFLGLMAFLIMATGPIALAQTHEAHQHGAARLNISLEGQQLELEIDSPLANFISFEHAPSTPEDVAEVKAMSQKLNNFSALFLFPTEAACKPQKAAISSEVIDPELLGAEEVGRDHGHEGEEGEHHEHEGEEGHSHEHESQEGHADLEGSFAFSCQNPQALSSIQVELFKAFPALESLEVQAALDQKGQKAFALTPENNAIIW